MVSRLVLVLGDQLSLDLSAIKAADPAHDVIVMAEVAAETDYVAHHPKKIAFTFAAMRRFAKTLRADGWRVLYSELDDSQNTQSIPGELIRRASDLGAASVLFTEPGEWRLIEALQDLPLPTEMRPDTRFLASHSEFELWAKDRKQLRMEFFYREMRRKTGILMEDGKPSGGKWNFDHDNRKAPPGHVEYPMPLKFEPDALVQEVLALVAARFSENFGDLTPFWFATCREEALQALEAFVSQSLPLFGDYQDAMVQDQRFLYHSVLSMYLNAGLLGWREICDAVEVAYHAGRAPLNAVEGFIRQIIGWREYMRGIYFLQGPDYVRRNDLAHKRALPKMFWGGETRMACIHAAVQQTKTDAYAHHIQRLMVTGNFALLAGIDPYAVHEWYLAVYADAYEWVEAPNVIGMSQFADSGIVASKPYISSGNYIDKMSDYCKSCGYSVKQKTGEGACPFNVLYWGFLTRHRTKFEGNPRMAQMYRVWERMEAGKQETILSDAKRFLSRMDAGEGV